MGKVIYLLIQQFVIKWRRDLLLPNYFNIHLCISLIPSSFMLGSGIFSNVVIYCPEIALERDECFKEDRRSFLLNYTG